VKPTESDLGMAGLEAFGQAEVKLDVDRSRRGWGEVEKLGEGHGRK
jgi:hypothetical protein